MLQPSSWTEIGHPTRILLDSACCDFQLGWRGIMRVLGPHFHGPRVAGSIKPVFCWSCGSDWLVLTDRQDTYDFKSFLNFITRLTVTFSFQCSIIIYSFSQFIECFPLFFVLLILLSWAKYAITTKWRDSTPNNISLEKKTMRLFHTGKLLDRIAQPESQHYT